jgi:hypothetical protein
VNTLKEKLNKSLNDEVIATQRRCYEMPELVLKILLAKFFVVPPTFAQIAFYGRAATATAKST